VPGPIISVSRLWKPIQLIQRCRLLKDSSGCIQAQLRLISRVGQERIVILQGRCQHFAPRIFRAGDIAETVCCGESQFVDGAVCDLQVTFSLAAFYFGESSLRHQDRGDARQKYDSRRDGQSPLRPPMLVPDQVACNTIDVFRLAAVGRPFK